MYRVTRLLDFQFRLLTVLGAVLDIHIGHQVREALESVMRYVLRDPAQFTQVFEPFDRA